MTNSKRKIINYRKIGDEINPLNMTNKEFINYLCHQFGFRIAAGWDGVERRHYRANWSEESEHNIKDRDEALVFLGISKNPYSENGLENRRIERRVQNKKIRKEDNKRKYVRRKDEIRARKQDAILYYSALGLGFAIVMITYGIIIGRLM
jgi:hypothetical protein